jgi:hypothetical protein
LIELAESARSSQPSVDKQLKVYNPLFDRPAPYCYGRAHFREILANGGDDAASVLDGFDITEDMLWPTHEDQRTFTYKDWFAMLDVGRHLIGPNFAINVSKYVGLQMYPFMEELTATTPDLYTIFKFWTDYSSSVEPMIDVALEKHPWGASLIVRYPLKGSLLEAFALSSCALVSDMVHAIAGRRITEGLEINLPNNNNQMAKFEDEHRIKIDRYAVKPTLTKTHQPCFTYKIKNELLYMPGIGRDCVRFNLSSRRFLEQAAKVAQLYPVTRVSEHAACIQSSAHKILTVDEMAEILGYQSRSYTRLLKAEGYTHKAIVRSTLSNQIKTLTKLGFTQQETSDKLGINSNRQFRKYV